MLTRIVVLLALFFLFSSFVSFASAGAEASRLGAALPGPVSQDAASGVRPGAASSASAPSPTLEETTDDGVASSPLIYRGETPFPDATTLIVETGCWGCDGGSGALYRMSRYGGGAVQSVPIFDAATYGHYITGFAMKPDASEMVVAVCSKLYCGGLGYAEPGSEITVYYSRDLGASWQVIGTSTHYFAPVSYTSEGIVFLMFREGQSPLYYLNSGLRVVPPSNAEFVHMAARRNGELSWTTASGAVVRTDGSELFAPAGAEHVTSVATNPGQPLLAGWKSTAGNFYLTSIDGNGSVANLALAPGAEALEPAAWWNSDFVIATMEAAVVTGDEQLYGMVPAMVNMRTGEAWSIAGFDVLPFGRVVTGGPQGDFIARGRNRVQVVLRGSFIHAAVEGCVPVRTFAIGGGGIDCVTSSTLLRPTGRQDRGWLQVTLPDGRQGWVDGRLVGW